MAVAKIEGQFRNSLPSVSEWRSIGFISVGRRLKSHSLQSRIKIFISIIFLGIFLIIFREQWLLIIGDFLVIEDTLHPADVIHVIAGEDYRTDYAIQLYKRGFGKTLFFTGGWCKFHQYNHGEHAQERSLAHDVSLNAIAYDDSKVTSTYMEAEKLKEWIAQSPYPIQSVIVVSDPFHMRRAQWTYRRVLGDGIEIQMAPVPFDLIPFKRAWWTDQNSRKYVQDEYVKFVYYFARYQITWEPVAEWLASFDTE